jgi:hypothetical protein
MSGFNEWLTRVHPEYLWEEDVNSSGVPNASTPISKEKEQFYQYGKDGNIQMGMDKSDITKQISEDPDFNNSYLQKQIKEYGRRNIMLKHYISFKGGVDKLHNWEYEDLVHGIAQKMFDKSIFPPEAAEKVLKNRRDLDERNKRALEQYISYQEQPMASNQQQPMASNQQQPMASNQQQPMASNQQQPMASNRNRFAQTNKPRTGLLKKIFRR